jgi:gliding motility-associated-like protein
VIKGLPLNVDNVLTVFNRWGNKVYQKSNYDNTWNGNPNVNGTLGTEKLPPGTYYYIIEFKGGDLKTTNGFVVLQY